jgi:hypothetical protein
MKTEKQSSPKAGVSHGGARPGAGRKKGQAAQITIDGLLQQVTKQTKGSNYEALLVADFLEARDSHDKQLLLKYHNLILNKVMSSLAKIEVSDNADAIESKKAAFADALAKLTGLQEDK